LNENNKKIMEKLPTIKDVANIANVSISTVSRVINNKSIISENTRKKILKVIKEINYEPNYIARSLSKNKTNTIGIILEDIINPFFSEIAKGIEKTLQKNSYIMLLTDSEFDAENELQITKTLLRNRVDGIIIAPINNQSESLKLLQKMNIPFFAINCRAMVENFNWISSNNLKGGYIATQYLIKLGHKRIMYIRGADDQPSKDKYLGFKKAVLENKLNFADQIILNEKAKNEKDGRKIMKKFLEKRNPGEIPTAIFATNDDVALGVLEVLAIKNIKVPEDISLIGYDDIKISGYNNISLTTIRQEKFKMGYIAAQELLSKIEFNEKDIVKNFLLEPRLIIRKSCRELK
jgi:LacI family transcriptional regulator